MDKISQLPDDLLIKILSLFPTKDVVAMRVLSKRWMSLWTLVPRLIFGVHPEEDDDREEEDAKSDENDHCSHFVYGTLLLHKAPVLERFHLNRVSGCTASEIDLWVRIAVDRFVRDLKIRFFPEYGIIRLPSTLFRCETLETLELRKVIISDVPSRVSFKSLKTFRLLFVKYPDEESFVRIISDCPVLEDLVVETCHDDNVELTIVDYFGELKLLGNNNNLPQVIEANLLSVSCHAKVLESFSRLNRISLCLPEEYPTGIVLSQLVCLEICSCEDNWTNMLVSVLQHSPKLKALKLALNHSVSEDRKLFWTQPSCVPQCLLCHLETFEWRGYGGTTEEVEKEVAIYILNNASRLVTATIYYPESFELERKRRMFKELEVVSRGSRSCKLTMG
ncbi:FBD domain-containing protein [Hirschfeldia incana]|nr:FBD domain-containing protein [Hirschfeldia incana]